MPARQVTKTAQHITKPSRQVTMPSQQVTLGNCAILSFLQFPLTTPYPVVGGNFYKPMSVGH